MERVQTTVFRIAQQIVAEMPEQHRPYLFKRILAVVREYVDSKVRTNGMPLEMIALRKYRDEIVNRFRNALRTRTGDAIQLPIYNIFQPTSSSRYVSFTTRKPYYETRRSHVNYVVCDPANDKDPPRESWPRLWEYCVAEILDGAEDLVRSFVKNDHLDFVIPFTFEGQQLRYLPDFLVCVRCHDGSDLSLILEVKGEEDNRDKAKYTYTRSWVASVNRDGQHGRWAFDIAHDPDDVRGILEKHADVRPRR